MVKNIRVLILSTLMIGLSYTYAQDLRSEFGVGIKAGTNYANIWDTEGEKFSADGRWGAAAGVYLSIPLGNLLAIQPEVMFSQKGFNSSGDFFGIDYKYERTSNWIDVPILVAIRPAEFISIVAGPQFNFLLSQKDKFTAGNFSETQKEEFENKDIRKFMLGLQAGLDINIKRFTISPRAMIDFLDNRGEGSATDPEYKNFAIQLTVGYRFL